MKGFALLVGALLGAALLYVTTAVGSQQAGPSRAEFNALKKQVATLKKHDAAVQAFLAACFTSAVPTRQYSDYESKAADGSTRLVTALDVARVGDAPQYYFLDVGQPCASAINERLQSLELVGPAATQR